MTPPTRAVARRADWELDVVLLRRELGPKATGNLDQVQTVEKGSVRRLVGTVGFQKMQTVSEG